MSRVEVDNIIPRNSHGSLNDPIILDVTFTTLAPLVSPLTFSVVYVGSAFSQVHDQLLQQVQIGPIDQASTLQFTLQCPPPDLHRIPRQELICTTALILSGAYLDQQFIRVGYYIHNGYKGEQEQAQLDIVEVIAKSERTIIAEKPRITKFQIQWEEAIIPAEPQDQVQESDGQADMKNKLEQKKKNKPTFELAANRKQSSDLLSAKGQSEYSHKQKEEGTE